ncbi:MAG TPA: GGDEF domain-containing protein [Longimicrobiaceae bacterium]|nr:GGDEF domain-containing protein [Longimicrobiaceae bacterium]
MQVSVPHRHRRKHALQGAVLALGAPAGWLLVRCAEGSPPGMELAGNPALYLYLFAIPLLVFVVFGGLLGGKEDRLLAANALLRDLSISDPLTGLRNTRYFWERLGEEYARVLRSGEPASVLVVDLDHFKDVNDRHGHLVGDRVLQETARAIGAAIRRADTAARVEDMAARVGGEEFAVLLPGTTLEDAAVVAERVRAEIATLEVPARDGERIGITASVGVACAAGELPGGDLALFTAADRAMYRAKCEGRDRVVVAGDGDAGVPEGYALSVTLPPSVADGCGSDR